MRMPRRAWRIAIVVLLIAAVVIATVFLLPAVIWVVDTLFIFLLTKGLGLW
jgi:hypothetical protein